MKGTPFYSGEYTVNVPGADERRVNLWPFAYYRDPALSIAWPVFEHTEEHVAIRPLFSAYGNTNGYWEYNLFWPLCQADTKTRDYRIFPVYWGEGVRAGNITQDYHVLFPLFWHYEDETRALFPFWISDYDGWSDGRFTERDIWLAWPFMHLHAGATEHAWHAGPFGRYRYLDEDETYCGFPWPLLFSWRAKASHGLFTPLYAFGESDKEGVRDGWAALPFLLAWHRWEQDDNTVNALLGLYNRHWSDTNCSGWLLPLCAYDRNDRLFLTPLFGWDTPDVNDPDGYWYPLTPLAGVRTGAHKGGWLFPLFDRTASATNDTFDTHVLLLGYAEHTRHKWKNGASERQSYGFFPLFGHSLHSTVTRDEGSGISYARVRQRDSQMLLRYSESGSTTCRSTADTAKEKKDRRQESMPSGSSPPAKRLTDYCQTTTSSGVFPLWSSASRKETRLDGSAVSSHDESAVLLALYDTEHETAAACDNKAARDDLRRRVLWRVWHYEKRNGDVSVDVIPFITYDTRSDGFRKTSFLWRFYRYEKKPDGKTALDLFFVPLLRD